MILQSKQTLYNQAIYNNSLEKTSLSTSDFEHSNDNLAMDWLRHLDKYSAKEQVRLYFHPIIDGYSSHLTHEFWSYDKKHKIMLFCLFLYYTHLTLLLDVVCFQSFKHYYTQAINRIVRLDNVEFGRLKFLAKFQTMTEKIFTKATIWSA